MLIKSLKYIIPIGSAIGLINPRITTTYVCRIITIWISSFGSTNSRLATIISFVAFLLFYHQISPINVLFVIKPLFISLDLVARFLPFMSEIGYLKAFNIVRQGSDNSRINIMLKAKLFSEGTSIIVFSNHDGSLRIASQINYHLHFLLDGLRVILKWFWLI